MPKTVDLLSRTAAELRTDCLYAEASAAHVAELLNQVAALEAKLANLVKETTVDLVLKSSGSAKIRPESAL